MQANPANHRPLRLDQLRRVVVLRALFLGDMLCAVPAFRALRRAAPQAQIVLAGLPWAHEFAKRFAAYIDEFVEFPGFPGLPEQPPIDRRIRAFVSQMRRVKVDLAIQMHGNGSISNRACLLMEPQRVAGFYIAGQECPDPETYLVFNDREHEVRRHLRLMELLGASPCGEELEFPVTDEDEARLAKTTELDHLFQSDYVCIHAGAKMATRRWPADRFAAVADALAERGHFVVLTGSEPERPLVQQVCDQLRRGHLNLCGRTDLGMLAALLQRARLVVTNDTGVSHLAAALRTPSVILFLGSDRARWSPSDRRQHRVVATEVPCQPCEHETCPIGFVCANPIAPERVLRSALDLLGDSDISRTRVPLHAAPANELTQLVAEPICQ